MSTQDEKINLLLNANANTISDCPFAGEHIVKIVNNYDADTIKVLFVYEGTVLKISVRVLGVDSPEIRGTTGNVHKLALEAKEYVSSLLPANHICEAKFVSNDKYAGRVVGDIKVGNPSSSWLSDLLISKNYVAPYNGKTKMSSEEWTAFADKHYATLSSV